MVEAKHADEEEDLEEGEEDVGVGGGEEDEGEDGGEAAVEDSRTHPRHRLHHAAVPGNNTVNCVSNVPDCTLYSTLYCRYCLTGSGDYSILVLYSS